MTVTDETDRARPVTLSTLEFDVLAEHLGIEAMPLVLKVPSPGRTRTERAELVGSAWDSLSARALGRPGRLDPELERMLRLLARPRCEVDGRLWFGRSIRVLAAGTGSGDSEQAVLAVKDGDTLTLRPAAATGLPREAVSRLPALRAGPGRSVTLRSADLDAAAAEASDDIETLRTTLRRYGIRTDDAGTLTRMVGEVGARGQFGAAARDRRDRRIRAAHVVGFFDSPHGRYVQLRRESPSGDPWSTVAPVDSRRLIGHVEELLAQVVDD